MEATSWAFGEGEIAERRSVSGGGVLAALHDAFVSFPIVCFTLALLTDIAYWRTANLMWQNFSSWLLFAGLVVGGLARRSPDIRRSRCAPGGPSRARSVRIGSVVVLVLAFVNSLVHAATAGPGWCPGASCSRR